MTTQSAREKAIEYLSEVGASTSQCSRWTRIQPRVPDVSTRMYLQYSSVIPDRARKETKRNRRDPSLPSRGAPSRDDSYRVIEGKEHGIRYPNDGLLGSSESRSHHRPRDFQLRRLRRQGIQSTADLQSDIMYSRRKPESDGESHWSTREAILWPI